MSQPSPVSSSSEDSLQSVNNAQESSNELEFIFLGTGTSSSLPQIKCLTAPPGGRVCKTCLSTLNPEGKKNARRNTSALVRVKDKHGDPKVIVIDVGKTFLAAALEWFPKYGLRKIDAVLITHAHADAMNGLDDLRGWTLNNNIQPYIDIYASYETFNEVGRAFPYLVSKEFASGGGDVPEFRWHTISDMVPFEIGNTGIKITPFSVHHGRVFSKPPAFSGMLPTPQYTSPPTPLSGRNSPSQTIISSSSIQRQLDELANRNDRIEPYLCTGFKIQDAVVYISDVSYIPGEVWRFLLQGQTQIPMFVLDCLRIKSHTSHFGLKQAVETVRRFKAQRSYLVGFTHDLSHEEYTEILRSMSGDNVDLESASKLVLEAVELVKGEPQWTRPAYDGLRVFVSENGTIRESGY